VPAGTGVGVGIVIVGAGAGDAVAGDGPAETETGLMTSAVGPGGGDAAASRTTPLRPEMMRTAHDSNDVASQARRRTTRNVAPLRLIGRLARRPTDLTSRREHP